MTDPTSTVTTVTRGSSDTVAAAPLPDRTFAAVLFDMDGTLISSVASVVRSWTRLADELGVAALRFGELHGIPARDLVRLLLPDHAPDVRERALHRVIEIEMVDTDDIEVLPGAAAALTALSGTGRCAIVTSCSRDLAHARLRAAGLPAPPVVVTADDVLRGKPDPEPFRTGAQRLGVDPADCLVVEDAVVGLEAARAAGAATLALTTTMTSDRLTADLVVADLDAVRLTADPHGVRVRLA